MQPFSLSRHYCLANVLPDRCSTGPAIPRVVSHESGDYRSMTLSSERPVRSHWLLPKFRYCPNWATTDTPGVTRRLPASTGRLLPNCSLCAFTHNHVSTKSVRAFTVPLLYSSGISPYCCSTPNQTIHHQRSTWISLTIHRTGSPQHLYIDSHNTLYFLYTTSICLSQDPSNNCAPTGSSVSLHTYPD